MHRMHYFSVISVGFFSHNVLNCDFNCMGHHAIGDFLCYTGRECTLNGEFVPFDSRFGHPQQCRLSAECCVSPM